MATATVQVNRVLMLVDATPQGGKVILRALHGWQTQLAEQQLEFTAQDLSLDSSKVSGDHTKMIAIIKAMKQLVQKLPQNRKSRYELVIVHTSQNVQHWLTNSASRKAELGQTLGSYVDRLGLHFRHIRFEKRDRKTVAALMQG